MPTMPRTVVTVAILLAAGVVVVPATAVAAQAPSGHVNPFIGTDDSNSPNPVPGGAGGSTYPGASVPFGMTQLSPDTPTGSPSGYRYSDDSIEEFSLTHFNGAGCANNEDVGILPMTGDLGASPGTNWTGYAAKHDKDAETASPGYYSATLDTYGGTEVELSATTRTSAMRMSFPAGEGSRVLVNASRSATGERSGSIAVDGRSVSGVFTGGGFCGANKTYKIFYVIEFDRDPSGHGTWSGGTVSPGQSQVSGTRTGAYVEFGDGGPQVNAKIGMSFVSAAGARANLAAEQDGFDFDAVRAKAKASWDEMLGRVEVGGGGEEQLQKFYTALYHVLQNPNIASDVNGDYRGFDGKVHRAGHPVYQNYSGWDIYRSWASLIALVAPDETGDIVKSMILDGQQGGLLPKWSHNNNEHFVMTGDPGPIVVASAHAFGARDFDTAEALRLMEKASEGGTMQGSPIRGRQAGYEERKFIHEDPSDSLEYSTSDFAVASFAKALGDDGSYDTHMERAQWWYNVFNTDSGYVHDRQADGSWPWPLNPASPDGYTEGNASQYTWMVPYNYKGLIDAMGGPQTAVQRLDHHFTELNGGLSRPYFYIGNEPEHGVPWAYHFAGKPSETMDAVRRVMDESFTTGPGGLPGNDDLGATSAWYVWSALGMYPPTPGVDTLALHGPAFASARIERPGGDIQINGEGAGAGNRYVESLSLNGKPHAKSWLTYRDIADGATLDYVMGDKASDWGTATDAVPPSFTDGGNQPPAAPRLGENLAEGKPATGTAACASSESAGKAVDGSLSGNSKWCSKVSGTKWLRVDLGSRRTVSAFVVKHAGLGGETTGWNTGKYTMQTSVDGQSWTDVASASGKRASRTYHDISDTSARYVRLSITTPTNNGDPAARIYEFEAYGG
ncbi:GH92 family glycosyl hydrolase [Stackebrandtia nassauensis]|uniref:Alpha-1,2-mannosidase n=1 Tax=Stackebrandtia nassauensis (strain DSM 44728 / CIP 108903 / NRRL B-16338 / NBRC 102104 / LLR-40K-21) TaxID=446470 RepID=D3Q7H1_STANL|nr:GH92 family glycosyl hydrolase [Stackebrandtia nassauensis]ADD44313.1 alpha-1,2-mannosidase [Stackebrandtia nassauensis DSM 44728]